MNPYKKKRLVQWVNIYLNQQGKFITSLQYRKQFKSNNNNISKITFISNLFMYQLFRDLFDPEMQRTSKQKFESTMIYSFMESYKRIDFLLYLLEQCEMHLEILHDVDDLISLYEIHDILEKYRNSQDIPLAKEDEWIRKINIIRQQTETPAAFLQRHMRPSSINFIKGYKEMYATKFHMSQYRVPVLLEKALLDYTFSTFSDDGYKDCYYGYYQRVESYTIIRNKAFDIFSEKYTFGPKEGDKSFGENDYYEINKFIDINYSLLDFHNSIKTWRTIQDEYNKIEQENTGGKKVVSKNDKINLLKKRMMKLSSYLFPNIDF